MTALLLLQEALYQRLTSDTSLMSMIKGVYDYAPNSAAFPYVRLGEDTRLQDDTKTDTGEDITHTMHIWSKYKGKKEVKEIIAKILSILSVPLTLKNGFFVDLTKQEMIQIFEEADGELQHGVIRFRFKIRRVG